MHRDQSDDPPPAQPPDGSVAAAVPALDRTLGDGVQAYGRDQSSDGETSWVIANARAGLLAWSYGDGMSKDWPGWYGWRGEPGDTVMGTVHPPAGRFGF